MRPGAFLLVFACLAGPVIAQDIQFGDNTGQYASDGLCDDRRFFGAGMAPVYNWTHAGTDAKDCQLAFRAGTVRLWETGVANLSRSFQEWQRMLGERDAQLTVSRRKGTQSYPGGGYKRKQILLCRPFCAA